MAGVLLGSLVLGSLSDKIGNQFAVLGINVYCLEKISYRLSDFISYHLIFFSGRKPTVIFTMVCMITSNAVGSFVHR